MAINEGIKKSVLVLKDGATYFGQGHGPTGVYEGEAVFTTGMVGYPESMTDPSYHKQFLTFTYPLIGNYGVPSYNMEKYGLPAHFESDSIKACGIVAHEICEKPSHWTLDRTFDKWLTDEGVPAISGIDTRNLTKRLREFGTMSAVMSVYEDEVDIERLKIQARKLKDPTDCNLVRDVSTPISRIYNEAGTHTIALLDCGAKYGILRSLIKRNMKIVLLRYDTPYDVLESYGIEGVLISNGPGNPDKVDTILNTINEAISNDLPVFGICMGNQLLALARGATTYKLPYGHRSQNQPCIDLGTNRCYITTQNHGYVVDTKSLENTDLDTWFVNANDESCEGLMSKKEGVFSVQFHPEACAGPEDSNYLFDTFINYLEK